MALVIPTRFRSGLSLAILLTFLLCSGGSLFCPMAYSSGGEGSHSSASHDDPVNNGTGCPELAVASGAPFGDVNPTMLPSIDLGVMSQHLGPACTSLLPDRSPPSKKPLLFLLLSTLRN